MTGHELELRARTLALRVMRLVDTLPRSRAAEVIDRQLLRSATAVGANCRAACRARSSAEFVARLAVVEEESDESGCRLELLSEGGLIKPARLADLIAECNEITAIIVASIRTARRESLTAGSERR